MSLIGLGAVQEFLKNVVARIRRCKPDLGTMTQALHRCFARCIALPTLHSPLHFVALTTHVNAALLERITVLVSATVARVAQDLLREVWPCQLSPLAL